MLLPRILSAVVLVPLVLFLVYLGGRPFALLVAIAAAWCVIEYARLMELGGFRPVWPMALAGAVGLAAAPDLPGAHLGGLALAATILGPGVYLLIEGAEPQRVLRDWASTVFGALLVGWPLAQAVSLRTAPGEGAVLWGLPLERGALLVLVVLTCTWASDTAGYAVGRIAGRRPFFANISPRKTREGALAAMTVPGLVGLAWAAPLGWPWVFALVVGGAAGVATVAGDLLESALKRAVGAKDSGALIPGHGGLLDRVDGLLFVLVSTALLTGDVWP